MTKTQKTSPIDMSINRARQLAPEARAEFLRQHEMRDLVELATRLVGEPKPKTPRPVLERRILAALADSAASNEVEKEEVAAAPAAPATAQDAPVAAPPHGDAGSDTAQPGADRATPAQRLPPVGTVIVKRDRHGAERCRCEVTEEGILYAGKLYESISGAALVAQRDLGLTSPTVNGYNFWQLDKRAAGERKPRAAKAPKDYGPQLEKAWERYAELVRAAIAADPSAVREQLGAQCNAHNELVASAISAGAAVAA